MNTKQIQHMLSDEEAEAKIAADRNADIKDIQKEAADLDLVMTDIKDMTIDQGRTLDRIEDKVKKADDNTIIGIHHLEEADIQVKKRRKRIVLIIIAAVLAIPLILGGGAVISAALGMSGTIGILAGAGIMLAGMAVLGGLGYGIYSLFKCCRPKPAQETDIVEEPKPDLKVHDSSRPAKTKSNIVKLDFSDDNIFSLSESPTLSKRGMDAVKGQLAGQLINRMTR